MDDGANQAEPAPHYEREGRETHLSRREQLVELLRTGSDIPERLMAPVPLSLSEFPERLRQSRRPDAGVCTECPQHLAQRKLGRCLRSRNDLRHKRERLLRGRPTEPGNDHRPEFRLTLAPHTPYLAPVMREEIGRLEPRQGPKDRAFCQRFEFSRSPAKDAALGNTKEHRHRSS